MFLASPRWGASQWGAGGDCSSDLRDTVLLAASQYSSSARKTSIMRTSGGAAKYRAALSSYTISLLLPLRLKVLRPVNIRWRS